MAGRYPKLVRKHCAKRRNCSLQAISPFPSVFNRLALQTGKTRTYLGKCYFFKGGGQADFKLHNFKINSMSHNIIAMKSSKKTENKLLAIITYTYQKQTLQEGQDGPGSLT